MTSSSSARCEALLAWYRRHARALPWRDTTEPYPVWISEIMLQQTQVSTVLPRYRQWLQRFPDIPTLANASEDAVLKAWEGLGYYRRARFLHAAARRIVDEHDGIFPQHFADILALPGIGRSTAGAIASFCFGARTPVLDGNVRRVLQRWHALPDAGESMLWPLAQQAIDAGNDPAIWNQAMMELGATLCGRTPDCAGCPVSGHCASAFRVRATTGRRRPVQHVHWRVHLHLHAEHGIWLIRRPAGGIWGGLWAPPISELAQPPGEAPCHVHALTHRRLHLYGDIRHDAPNGQGQWCKDLVAHALPTGILRLLHVHELVSDEQHIIGLDAR